MAAKPLVTISIVVWNGLAETKDCLKSLSKISYKNIEIIVVDNGSTDETVSFILKEYPKINLIKNNQNLGFTGGHNTAQKVASGKYILLLNNDTEVTEYFLEPLVEDLENDEKLAAVQSKTFLSKEMLDNVSSFLTPIGFLKHFGFKEKDKTEYQTSQYVFSPKAACLLIRANVVKKVGLFDDTYFAYFEETDWAWRVYLLGFRILFEPRSIIYHKLGRTSTKLTYTFINYHSFKNRLRTILKNASLSTLLYMLPLHLLTINILAFSFLIQGKVSIALSILKAQLWNIKNLSGTLNERNKIQKIRVISDKELFNFAMQPLDIKGSLKHYLLVRKNI
jgi:GT2 family glycosyltransferase